MIAVEPEVREKIANLELSVRVLSEILKEEGLLDDDRIREKAEEVRREAARQVLRGDGAGAERTGTEWEPKTASEEVEYADGTTERNGPKFDGE